MNLNSITKPSWQNQGFLDSVQALNMEVLRYPGGTTSQYWDWKNGTVWPISYWQNRTFQSHQNLAQFPSTPHTLADYKVAIDSLNAEPLFVLNVLSDTLESQMDFLRYADNIGLEVKYIELGNEIYFEVPDFVNRYPTPTDYANEMVVWIDSIQTEFTNAKIAVIGASENPLTPNGGNSPARIKHWNDAVFSIIPTGVDVTFHRYYGHGNGGNLVDVNRTFANAMAELQKEESFTVDSLTKGRKAWWTEYNLTDNLSGNHSVATSWLHGLFTSLLHLKKLENPKNEMLIMHQITGKEPFGAIGSYFTPIDTLNNPITPLGKAIGLISMAEQNTTDATSLDFSVNPAITSNGAVFSSLLGWRFEGSQVDNLIILNVSSQQFNVDLSALSGQAFSVKQITSSNLTALDPESNHIQVANGQYSNSLMIEPYSLAMVDMRNVVLSTEGILDAEEGISVYPNPAKTELSIQFKTPFDGFVRLFATNGKPVLTRRIEDVKSELIQVGTIESGIYFLSISSISGVTVNKKILIEK